MLFGESNFGFLSDYPEFPNFDYMSPYKPLFNHLKTSCPDIFAAGDVAEHHGIVYGTWAPAQFQASIAGMNAIGQEVEFGGIPRSNALKVLDVELFSIGQIEPEDASYQVIEDQQGGCFFRFLFRDSHLVGSVLLGDANLATKVKKSDRRSSRFFSTS